MDEQLLIKQVLKKDRKAEKQFYSFFANKMYRLCYRYINNPDEAQDVMIEAFYKAFTKIQTFEFRGAGSLEKWLKTIMINDSLMFLRRNRKMEIVSLELFQKQEKIECEECEIDAEYIYNLVINLPIGYRTIFNMFAIDGFSHQEIAEKLGISEGTSKSQLNRARNILKEKILQQNNNERKLG